MLYLLLLIGHYLYMEASLKSPGSIHTIITPKISSSEPLCLSFASHMSGYHLGSLSVYSLSSKMKEDTILSPDLAILLKGELIFF